MKTCARCKAVLPLDSFGKSRKNADGLAYNCKPCGRAYSKQHYAQNKAAYNDKARAWEARRRAYILAAKSKPCADCGGTFHPCAMDFDHTEGEPKAFNVSAGHKIGCAKVDAEIAKCEVVCANCHRLRTYQRRTA